MQPPKELLHGRYRVLTLLGKGGMGSVWRGEHVTLGTPVAIKLLEPSLAENEKQRARFLREARAAASLRGANVVHIIDHGVEDDTPFIVMELLDGESLGTRLRREKKLHPEDVAMVFAGVGRAMARAHKAGIVHRDLKPDNIFLAQDGDAEPVPKVVDFGIAKLLDADAMPDDVATNTGTMLGTPHYMSPEQARGRKDIDERADLWAMTVIAYQCIVGERPFVADALGELVLRICSDRPPVPSEHGDVPPGFDAWFERGVRRSIDERFQSVHNLVRELEDVLAPGSVRFDSSSSGERSGETPAAPQPTPPAVGSSIASPSVPAPRKRLVAGLAVATLAVVPAIYWISSGDRAAPVEDPTSPTARPSSSTPAFPTVDTRADVELRRSMANDGWGISGGARNDYTVRLDPSHPRNGHATLALVPLVDPEGKYGTWMRQVPAAQYSGRRVRLSSYTKTDGATQRADFWARVQAVDSPGDGGGLGGHWVPLSAHSDWTKREIVLEVPEDAEKIHYGVGIAGPGRLWLDTPAIEEVGNDVPVTGHEHDQLVDGWVLTGAGASASRLVAEGEAVRVANPEGSAGRISVIRPMPAKEWVGRAVSASFEVHTQGLFSKPTCFLRTQRSRYARSAIEEAAKAVVTTTEGFERCELSVDVGPTARWILFGLRDSYGRGEVWLRRAELTKK